MAKKVVYIIYAPAGYPVRVYDNRKEAKAFQEGVNWLTPEWEHDRLYKIQAKVIDTDGGVAH